MKKLTINALFYQNACSPCYSGFLSAFAVVLRTDYGIESSCTYSTADLDHKDAVDLGSIAKYQKGAPAPPSVDD